MSDEELQAELARLRAENVRLNAIAESKKDERAAEMNAGLMRLAAHADTESSLQAIQAQGKALTDRGPTVGGPELSPVAVEAVSGDPKFWGLA